MTTVIYSNCDDWDVTNMMYRRIMDFACEVAIRKASDGTKQEWINHLRRFVETQGSGITIHVDSLFESQEEKRFWGDVLFELADFIYKREIGNQETQDWQVSTIWATYDLARLLAMYSPSRVEPGSDG